LDPTGDKADHTLTAPTATIDPIYLSSPESNSKGGGKVYMVGNGEELPKKTIEEIQWEADQEIAHVSRLAREAERGKRHNGFKMTHVH
jgi:hypothetical protein